MFNFPLVAQSLSSAAIPFIIIVIFAYASYKKINVYEVFVEGAKEGFGVAIQIIPYLIAMLLAIGMLRAAGVLDFIAELSAPILSFIGIPSESLPMALIRPMSGSGADGILVESIKTHGVDSLPATTSAVMAGSTETTFYVLAVYFASVGLQKIRYALWVGLIADLAGVLAACWFTKWLLF